MENGVCGRGLEINPNKAGCISSSCTQHQGGRCSACETSVWLRERRDKTSAENRPQPNQGKEDYPLICRLDLTEENARQFNDDR